MKTVVKTLHGSHLYGTNYEKSDRDYKNIFAMSLSELITGHDDFFRIIEPDDTENFSVKKLALLLNQQQTNAIEMLFTPNEFIVETSPAWEELRANKHRLVSKNIMPFVGYAKQQARMYSEKGNSFNMLEALNEDLKRWLCYHAHSKETQAFEYTEGSQSSIELPKLFEQYPNLISRGEKLSNIGVPIPYLQILNKQFECFVPVLEWKERLQRMIDTYGNRAKAAAEQGAFDRKAVYHAWRIIDEAVELLETGEIVLPRSEAAIVIMRSIRFDDAVSFDEASGLIMDRYNYLMETALPKTTLQESIDREFLNQWYLSTQSWYIKQEIRNG